jgi:hypothetical protein
MIRMNYLLRDEVDSRLAERPRAPERLAEAGLRGVGLGRRLLTARI